MRTNTPHTHQAITFVNPLLMSAEAAKTTETMTRENAFVVPAQAAVPQQAGVIREREGEVADAAAAVAPLGMTPEELQKFKEEQNRIAMMVMAKTGKYTRAQAEALGFAHEKWFVPVTAGYLKTEHVFERLDADRYTHPILGDVNGFKYGQCIHCKLTEEFLRTRPADQRPSLYHCTERHKKAEAAKKAYGFGARKN